MKARTMSSATVMSRSLMAAIPVILGLLGFSAWQPEDPEPEWNRATTQPDRIILTISDDPATTQSVTWRTDAIVTKGMAMIALASPGPGIHTVADTIHARTERLDARAIPNAGVQVSYHSVTFRNLQPDTLYAYRVGDGVNWSEWFHFRTASKVNKPFSFIYFGDAQNDILSLWSRVLRRSYAQAPDARFIVHAGDLVTTGQSNLQWGEWFRAGGFIHATVPSLPAPGNHEYDPITEVKEGQETEEVLSVFWKPQFELPQNGIEGQKETSYFVDYQGTRMVILNSSRDQEAQAAWLDAVLARNPQPWTIISFHHPIFSSGKERDNAKLRALWKPVFDKHSVDLVIQGHDHTYARGRTDPVKASNTATGVNLRDETGTVYVVSVGGRKMYEFKKGAWSTYAAQLDRRAENTQLYQVVRVAGDTLQFRAYTAIGSPYDSFDLVRRPNRPNLFVERLKGNEPTRSFADGPAYTW
jgi:3',5'-cyclic AMP phosphodiesterase CpdA